MRFARELPFRRAPLSTVEALAFGLVGMAAAAVTVIGSDALWLPALGDRIRASWSLPHGIPFAAADSTGWVNTTALGQLVLSYAHVGGSLGIVTAQVAAAVGTLAVLATDAALRGARSTTTAIVIVTAATGAAASFLIARAQLLSFIPFAVLLVLVRRQHDRPTAAIWWSVPLIAVWGNLHGAVLVGMAVLGCHLLLSRLRVSPVSAVAVGVASLLATCLNPGLAGAPRYYIGVFSGEATTDNSGMWSRLTLSNPFDVLLVLAALALGIAALRRRLPLWEYAAGLGLLAATASAARHGVWLLLFLFVPAAVATRCRGAEEPPPFRSSGALPRAVVAVSVVGLVSVLALRAASFQAADAESARIATATSGQVVLAPEPLAESLAAAGATVWASNPLDAFVTGDQAAYLAFLHGDAAGARAALGQADVVVAAPGTAQARIALETGFTYAGSVGRLSLFRKG